MAANDVDLSEAAPGGAPLTGSSSGQARYTSDDFRLDLGGPQFTRDDYPTGANPLLRPISWDPVNPTGPNMLGSIPDATDAVDSPSAVELPAIIEAEVPREVTPVHVLTSQTSRNLPTGSSGRIERVEPEPPKPLRLAESPAYAPKSVAATRPAVAFAEPPRAFSAPVRKKGFARRFVSLVLVLATLAGGAFAVKRFVLDVDNWDPGIESLANEVSAIRGLNFESAVSVVTLPMQQYAVQFTDTVLGLEVLDRGLLAAEWRAVGLLTGPLDSEMVGLSAAVDSPAFYDPLSATVYEVAGLPAELHRFAVERALVYALLDQHVQWSERLIGASPTSALAIRALVDADAIAVAREALESPEIADTVARQIASLRTESVTEPSPSVWASSALGRPGLPLQATFGSLSARQRTAQFDLLAVNDAVAYDAARPPSVPSTADVVLTTAGMMYWYHALAGRIGSSAAWVAASVWNGDVTSVSASAADVCVESTITSLDVFSAQVMLAAFQQWAAAALPESSTEVAMASDTMLTVKACDPGTGAPTADMSAIVPFGGAAVEATVVAIGRAGTTNLPERAQVCLVEWARGRGGALDYPADSPEIVESSTGWKSPYVATHAPSSADVDACRL